MTLQLPGTGCAHMQQIKIPVVQLRRIVIVQRTQDSLAEAGTVLAGLKEYLQHTEPTARTAVYNNGDALGLAPPAIAADLQAIPPGNTQIQGPGGLFHRNSSSAGRFW